MVFQPGNELWKLSNPGRKRKYDTPQKLKRACVKYFEWVQNNPIKEEKLFQHDGKIVRGTIHKMRAMTKQGLNLHLQITHKTWDTYRECDNEGIREVVAWADAVIEEQKFTGAAAGMLNPMIIARDLGLKESVSSEQTGELKIEIVKNFD